MINPSASPIRIMQPGSSLLGRSEVTRTPGILLPKQARYQLRYTPIYLVLCLFFRLPACFARPACGSRKKPRDVRLLDFFDRGACSASLHPPPAALGFAPQSAGATNCATPRYIQFCACSSGCPLALLARLAVHDNSNSILDFPPKVNGPGPRFCPPPKEKGETSCEASPFGKCFAVLPAGITWHPLPPCGR